MSADSKNSIRINFAEHAKDLADIMRDVPPVLFLYEAGMQKRDNPEAHDLSGEAGRVAVISMTICNPLTLKAASIIEGAMP